MNKNGCPTVHYCSKVNCLSRKPVRWLCLKIPFTKLTFRLSSSLIIPPMGLLASASIIILNPLRMTSWWIKGFSRRLRNLTGDKAQHYPLPSSHRYCVTSKIPLIKKSHVSRHVGARLKKGFCKKWAETQATGLMYFLCLKTSPFTV